MTRTSKAQLQGLIDRLNLITNSPSEPYTKTDKGYQANIGNYHLDGAYGGWKLVRMVSPEGGIQCPISMGYESKRDCYRMIAAFIAGISQQQYEERK